MAYILSDNISVFPSTRRMNVQASARLVSEQSFANQISKLIETNGFVITPELDDDPGYNPNDPFEFNIHGYFFWVSKASEITGIDQFSTEDSIYGNIYLDKQDNYVELKSIDASIIENGDKYYQGLVLSSQDLTDPTIEDHADYSLKLFEKVSNGTSTFWAVPIESRLKFVYTFALGVDGGEITDPNESESESI